MTRNEPRGADARDRAGTAPSALRRIGVYGVAGLLAGGLIYLIEALDRLRLLRHNLEGPADALHLAVMMAATILAVGLLCLVSGTLWTATDAVRARVSFASRRVPERWRPTVAFLGAAALVAVALRLVSAVVPWAVEGPLYRLIKRIDTKLVPLGLLAQHPKIVFALGLAAVTLALMLLHAWLFSRRGRRSRPIAAAVAIIAVAITIVGFAADSRIEFTRYEFMFHIPLEVIYATAAVAAVMATARAIGPLEQIATSRPAILAAALALAAGLGSIAWGAVAMDTSQTAKALFWNRSVIARRVFQFARFASDRDRDGFSAAFGGGDLDDRDPRVHPLAGEIPGNNVDDNCIGGDLAAGGHEVGTLFAPARLELQAPIRSARAIRAPVGTRNVIILSIDCLRADHLGCYGYGKPTSPNIDRFAGEALVFENAYAQGTNTGHSLTSLFRSSYADDIFDDRIPGFARLLRQDGYTTTLINAVRTDVWLNATRWQKYREMSKDFDTTHDDGARVWNAEELTDRAIEFLSARPAEQPHLTWVHYFDCHRPRKRHAGLDFGPGPKGVFDSNVAFVDRALGRLFDYLRSSGALDTSIVFIIADHGEAFSEHGAQDHSNKPYNNNTLVPLIVRAPGLAAGRFGEPCGLIDVAPTALAFAGLDPPTFYRGIDLLSAAGDDTLPKRWIISETPRNLIESPFYSWALVDWPHKIVWDVRSNTTEIFDLAGDPGEQHNLADRDPALAARMRAQLGSWLDRETARTGAVGPGDQALSDEDGD
jgi:arylsulfatase A-like enzyme